MGTFEAEVRFYTISEKGGFLMIGWRDIWYLRGSGRSLLASSEILLIQQKGLDLSKTTNSRTAFCVTV